MSNSKYLQKIGGAAGIIQGAAYLVSILFFMVWLSGSLHVDPGPHLEFVSHNLVLMRIGDLIAYWITGATTVVIALALYERLKAGSPALAQVAMVFGFIWAGLCIGSANLMINDLGVVATLYDKDPVQAATVWSGLDAVETGLVSGNEIVGSLWVLLLSLASLRTVALTKGLNYFGIGVGAVGLFTSLLSFVLPETKELIYLFGMGMIPWCIWVGIVMLRASTDQFIGSMPISTRPLSE